MSTITVKDGNGNPQSVNVLPSTGQNTMSGSLPVALASDQPIIQVYDNSYSTHAPAYYQVTAANTSASLGSLVGSIPSWATAVILLPENCSIRYRADGTAPTTSIGMPISSGAPFAIQGNTALSSIQLILSSNAAIGNTVSVEFRG